MSVGFNASKPSLNILDTYDALESALEREFEQTDEEQANAQKLKEQRTALPSQLKLEIPEKEMGEDSSSGTDKASAGSTSSDESSPASKDLKRFLAWRKNAEEHRQNAEIVKSMHAFRELALKKDQPKSSA